VNDLNPSHPRYEAVGPEMMDKQSVQIRGLRKEFPSPNGEIFAAVDETNLNLYEDQIFVLLGHNGAGKTTTINLLSGMLPVTSGDAYVYGSSVVDDMNTVRRSLGFCPQHDVIWHNLTVEEHLRFFAACKGVSSAEIQAEVDEIIDAVSLAEKRHSRAGTLSGGQKRRMSAGIALIGGSRLVFLDEPSSGVDPFSRRQLWDCLKTKKKGRTLVLTTHFMDEAEELGDRIAIMAGGQVKCCGSSLYLKSQYGVGYSLTISRNLSATAAVGQANATLRAVVKQHVPQAELISEVGGETVFRLPMEGSSRFPPLFEEFEKQPQVYGMDFFSISVTTLEEVFIRVGRDHHEADQNARDRVAQTHLARQLSSSFTSGEAAQRHSSARNTSSRLQPLEVEDLGQGNALNKSLLSTVTELPSSTGSALLFRHFHALLAKRFQNSKRDRKGWCCQVGVPIIFLSVALLSLKFGGAYDFPAAPLNLSELPAPEVVLYGSASDEVAQRARSLLSFARDQSSLSSTAGSTNITVSTSAQFDEALLSSVFRGDGSQRFGAFRFNHIPDLQDRQAAGSSQQVAGVTLTAGGSQNPGVVTAGGKSLNLPVSTLWSESGSLYDPDISQSIETVELGALNNRIQVDLFWNSSARDGLPLFFGMLSELVLRATVPDGQDVSVSFSNKPFPLTAAQRAFPDSQTALYLSLGFAFIPASYCSFIVRERETNSKHLQVLSGVNFVIYWLATWVWDVINYMVPAVLSVALIAIFGIHTLVADGNFGCLVVIVILYGVSVTSFTYMISFFFKSHTSAQNLTIVFYLFTGGILNIISLILGLIPSTTRLRNDVLVWIFRILPNFCLADALSNLITRETPFIWAAQGCPPEGCNPFDLVVCGWDLLYMSVVSVCCFAITLFLEYAYATPYLRALLSFGSVDAADVAHVPDSDVQREEARVKSGEADSEAIVVKGLRKVFPGGRKFPPKVAVAEMYFGVPQGQCFGYLGLNGAGKSTTMKVLTGEELATAGGATLGGMDIATEQTKVRSLIGYCPQFDALIDNLTAREHLLLFGRIKGLHPKRLHDYVDALLHRLTLGPPFADRVASTFSGGMKRKLSLGIALVGDPSIVFLDEPSTGVDPESRRFMWGLISETMAGRAVILTTHSMDECEALCQRIGIMVNGRLRCLGSAAHLKATHGYGLQFDVAFRSDAPLDIVSPRLAQFVLEHWPRATQPKSSKGARRVQFRLPKSRPISEVFRLIEQKKDELAVAEYSVSETTLEQIFISFAKEQIPEGEEAETLFCSHIVDAEEPTGPDGVATGSVARPDAPTEMRQFDSQH